MTLGRKPMSELPEEDVTGYWGRYRVDSPLWHLPGMVTWTGTDLADDMSTPVRRQRWVCVEDETGVWWPDHVPCQLCHGDGEVLGYGRHGRRGTIECPACNGTGEDRRSGDGFVTEEASDE